MCVLWRHLDIGGTAMWWHFHLAHTGCGKRALMVMELALLLTPLCSLTSAPLPLRPDLCSLSSALRSLILPANPPTGK